MSPAVLVVSILALALAVALALVRAWLKLRHELLIAQAGISHELLIARACINGLLVDKAFQSAVYAHRLWNFDDLIMQPTVGDDWIEHTGVPNVFTRGYESILLAEEADRLPDIDLRGRTIVTYHDDIPLPRIDVIVMGEHGQAITSLEYTASMSLEEVRQRVGE